MSPSSTPTRAPIFASASARFTDTVVLPTPPLPAPTAITFFTPGSGGWPLAGCEAERTLEVISTDTSATPGSARTAATAWSRIWVCAGQAGVVSSMVAETRPPLIATSLTKPSDTMSRSRSGSTTALRAFRTASRVGVSDIFFDLIRSSRPRTWTTKNYDYDYDQTSVGLRGSPPRRGARTGGGRPATSGPRWRRRPAPCQTAAGPGCRRPGPPSQAAAGPAPVHERRRPRGGQPPHASAHNASSRNVMPATPAAMARLDALGFRSSARAPVGQEEHRHAHQHRQRPPQPRQQRRAA